MSRCSDSSFHSTQELFSFTLYLFFLSFFEGVMFESFIWKKIPWDFKEEVRALALRRGGGGEKRRRGKNDNSSRVYRDNGERVCYCALASGLRCPRARVYTMDSLPATKLLKGMRPGHCRTSVTRLSHFCWPDWRPTVTWELSCLLFNLCDMSIHFPRRSLLS